MNINMNNIKITTVGLGYVGLPLSLLLAKKFDVTGFDISAKRIEELNSNIDLTKEATSDDLKESTAKFTDNQEAIADGNIVIVTVPTPIDQYKKPDLRPIESATRTVGKNLTKDTIVVYESTVYPGLTEEICIPILEKESGLKWKQDFNVGYSPERVNPGDKNHTIDKIVKVVAGDTEEVKNLLAEVYGSVVTAGIHVASDIKTAEAAKVIENTQRDLNIALMNELSMIFNRMNINTLDVIEAAGTKWNFLKFTPGLVGGHCIGVDPYYLTSKAEKIGYYPQVILSGREINDNMGRYVAQETIKRILKSKKETKGNKILICGFTFKENVPDLRNTRVIDVYNELTEYGFDVDVYDPVANNDDIKEEYNISMIDEIGANYLAVIVAVNHKEFLTNLKFNYCKSIQSGDPIVVDIKGIYREMPEAKNDPMYFSL
ncbi:MAG: nucleotide sugar dehydrogenase [Oligoflexia bacterium]|nr:nucleotide sugar dehydrogenase [Oligoflexia bacterium]